MALLFLLWLPFGEQEATEIVGLSMDNQERGKKNTKYIIADAFIALLNQKDIDRITVKDITSACHISRQTFYYHYQDIYGLFYYLVNKISSVEYDIDQITAAISYSDRNAGSVEGIVCIFVSIKCMMKAKVKGKPDTFVFL